MQNKIPEEFEAKKEKKTHDYGTSKMLKNSLSNH